MLLRVAGGRMEALDGPPTVSAASRFAVPSGRGRVQMIVDEPAWCSVIRPDAAAVSSRWRCDDGRAGHQQMHGQMDCWTSAGRRDAGTVHAWVTTIEGRWSWSPTWWPLIRTGALSPPRPAGNARRLMTGP